MYPKEGKCSKNVNGIPERINVIKKPRKVKKPNGR